MKKFVVCVGLWGQVQVAGHTGGDAENPILNQRLNMVWLLGVIYMQNISGKWYRMGQVEGKYKKCV